MTTQTKDRNLEVSAALPMCNQSVGRGVVVRRGEAVSRERKNQNGGVVKEYEAEAPKSRVLLMRYRARCECMLDYLRLRGKFDQPEWFEAGMIFRGAYLHKAEGVKTKDCLFATLNNGNFEHDLAIDRATSAERILRQAYAELTPAQALIVVAVCGADEGCGTHARMKTLRRALDRLARLWNLV